MNQNRRTARPAISKKAALLLKECEKWLVEKEDMQSGTRRNYLSDLQLFMSWVETENLKETENLEVFQASEFSLELVTTPLVVRYRNYLQKELGLRPTSVNRTLVSLKRYFGWLHTTGQLTHDPLLPVKLVSEVMTSPRQLSDKEEEALIAAVNTSGDLRDQAILTLMLHTGLRASEVCELHLSQLHLSGSRSGFLTVVGKGNKQREVPLNATVRRILERYLKTLSKDGENPYLFPSHKTGQAMTARALGHLVAKYARLAHLSTVSPHDLRHRFGYRMAQNVPLHRLAQIMGHNSLDTTLIYVRASQSDLQKEVEKIAWQ